MTTQVWKVDRTLWQQQIRQLLDKQRIDNRGCNRAVTQYVLLNARCVHNVRVKIDQRFTIWKIERRISVHLSPDEHVFSRKRDLLVAVPDIRAHRPHDLLFWQIDLWVQVGHAKLATP